MRRGRRLREGSRGSSRHQEAPGVGCYCRGSPDQLCRRQMPRRVPTTLGGTEGLVQLFQNLLSNSQWEQELHFSGTQLWSVHY